MANPKFVIVKRGKSHVLMWRRGGERPASDAEVSLWNQLQRVKQKLRTIQGRIDDALAEADTATGNAGGKGGR